MKLFELKKNKNKSKMIENSDSSYKSHKSKFKFSEKLIKRMNNFTSLQKNLTITFNNKTNQLLNLIKELKSENNETKNNLIPDISPFIKTLNEMQIHNFNSLNSLKLTMDNFQKNKNLIETGIENQLKQLRERLHLNKRPKSKNEKNKDDVFSEDDKFLTDPLN